MGIFAKLSWGRLQQLQWEMLEGGKGRAAGDFCHLSRRQRPSRGKMLRGEEAVGFGLGMRAQRKVAVVYLPWKGLQHFALLRNLNNVSVKYKTVYIRIASQEGAEVGRAPGSTLS